MTTDATATDAISAIATKVTYAASTATMVAGLTIGDWAALVGIGSTLTMLAFTIWLKLREDARAQREHEKRMSGQSDES